MRTSGSRISPCVRSSVEVDEFTEILVHGDEDPVFGDGPFQQCSVSGVRAEFSGVHDVVSLALKPLSRFRVDEAFPGSVAMPGSGLQLPGGGPPGPRLSYLINAKRSGIHGPLGCKLVDCGESLRKVIATVVRQRLMVQPYRAPRRLHATAPLPRVPQSFVAIAKPP